jgi:hypothetical protein
MGTAAALLFTWPDNVGIRVVAAVLCMLGVFCGLQARAGTCALLAFAGERDLDRGRQPVHDRHERAVLQRTATMIVLQSLTIGSLALVAAALV